MKTLVIADLHLRFNDEREADIIRFFNEVAPSFNKIIILGDFFEFWYGFKDVIISDYFNVLRKLKELTDRNIDIVFIEGNHDFNMGDFFKNILGVKVYKEEYHEVIGKKKFLFMHGDTLNLAEDRFYKILRKMLRSEFIRFIMNSLPPHSILSIAKRFSNASRKYLYKKFDLQKTIDKYKKAKHYDFVLMGHFHRNFNYKNFYLLGDWSEKFNYVSIDESGCIEYKIFH